MKLFILTTTLILSTLSFAGNMNNTPPPEDIESSEPVAAKLEGTKDNGNMNKNINPQELIQDQDELAGSDPEGNMNQNISPEEINKAVQDADQLAGPRGNINKTITPEELSDNSGNGASYKINV